MDNYSKCNRNVFPDVISENYHFFQWWHNFDTTIEWSNTTLNDQRRRFNDQMRPLTDQIRFKGWRVGWRVAGLKGWRVEGLRAWGLDEWKGWRVERAKGWRARLLLHLPTTHMLKHFMFFHRWVAVPIRSSVQINCQWCDYTKRASSKTKNGLSKLEAKE